MIRARIAGAFERLAPAARHGARLARQRASGSWLGPATFVLSFDVDTEDDCAALPMLVDELGRRGIRASFAIVGRHITRFPREHGMLVASGHEILCHSFDHREPTPSDPSPQLAMTEDELARDLIEFDRALASIGGRAVGYRTPHFGWQRDPRVYALLARDGLLSSSTLQRWSPARGGAPAREAGVWELPVSECPRHPASTLDSWHCTLAPDGRHRADPVAPFVALLDALERHRAYGSVYLDPRAIAHDRRYLTLIAELAARRGRISLMTYAEVVAGA